MGILRQVFGPSREEVWRQLSDEIGAAYVEGGFWKGSKVQGQHEEWTITLDTFTTTHSTGDSTHSSTYTRMRAPYVNRDGFQFKIYRNGFFSDIGKLFGMQDVEVGDPEFDRDFVIQGTDEGKLKDLFRSARLRQLIQTQPAFYMTVKDDEGWFGTTFPEGVDELYFQAHGVVKDVERLKGLYQVFAETLERLCEIGSAYEHDPRVEL